MASGSSGQADEAYVDDIERCLQLSDPQTYMNHNLDPRLAVQLSAFKSAYTSAAQTPRPNAQCRMLCEWIAHVIRELAEAPTRIPDDGVAFGLFERYVLYFPCFGVDRLNNAGLLAFLKTYPV